MSVASQSISPLQSSSPAAPPAWRIPGGRASIIAVLAVVGIATHLAFRWAGTPPIAPELPLYVVLVGGGVPLVLSLALKLIHLQFGSDLLAGISIVAAVFLREYLAGA